MTADAVPARRRVGIATDRRNILVLSAGRRVELVQQFQAAARELLPGSLVLAGDASPELSAACQIADRSVRLPRVSDAAYRAELVAVCRSQSVGLIVPTTDTELLALASLRDVLEADGTAACVSDSSLVAACRDKRVTGDVFSAVDIPYPTVHDKHALTFPCVCKPVNGSSSIGVSIVHTAADLTDRMLNDPQLMFMESATSTASTPSMPTTVVAGS